ncbi:MAG: cell division protein ZapA [Pseudohongiellaceae bacterium]
MKQVEVTILGQGYILGCPAGGEAKLESAVSLVDREMSMIRDTGKIKARERIAVLAALNLAYRMTETDPPADTPPAQAPGARDGEPADTQTQAALASLQARLDAALSDDGHLL